MSLLCRALLAAVLMTAFVVVLAFGIAHRSDPISYVGFGLGYFAAVAWLDFRLRWVVAEERQGAF